MLKSVVKILWTVINNITSIFMQIQSNVKIHDVEVLPVQIFALLPACLTKALEDMVI